MLKAALLSILMTASPVLFWTPANAAGMSGTPKEQAACRPDARRFCSHVKQGSDSNAYLSCLEANRSKLSKACLAVLQSHGQ
jgi:hypothetical protein